MQWRSGRRQRRQVPGDFFFCDACDIALGFESKDADQPQHQQGRKELDEFRCWLVHGCVVSIEKRPE